MTVDVASRVKDKVLDTKQQVYGGAEALQAKTGEVGSQVKSVAEQVRDKVPSPVAARLGPLMASAMQRPLPTATAMVVLVMVLRLLLRRLWRGNR
ncbi:MAG: hypothetical protein WCB57_05125 [Pseudonocardiaceae bacterium]